MRAAVLSIAVLVVGAGVADAQFRNRVVARPTPGGSVVPAAPAYITPTVPTYSPAAAPGTVGPVVAPRPVVGNGYNFYPGRPYTTYPSYRYWR